MKANKILNVLVTITSVILATLLLVLFVQTVNVQKNNNKEFKENVVIAGVNVKGLTKIQAETKINSALNDKIENLNITLKYKDKTWNYTQKDLQVSTNIHTIVEDAYKHTQLVGESKQNIKLISSLGYNYDVAFNHIFVDFKDKV